MADAIVSVALEQLVEVTGRQLQLEVKLVAGVDDEVKKLTSNFEIIQAVLVDAEQRQVTETAVRVWLEKLKDVSYDMDDVLDEWNTAILKRLQIEGAESAHTVKRKDPTETWCQIVRILVFTLQEIETSRRRNRETEMLEDFSCNHNVFG